MVPLHIPFTAVHSFVAAATGVPRGHGHGPADVDPLVQGAHKALAVYSKTSDAYASHHSISPSIALWAVLIAAAVVLLEWVVARRGGR